MGRLAPSLAAAAIEPTTLRGLGNFTGRNVTLRGQSPSVTLLFNWKGTVPGSPRTASTCQVCVVT